MIQSFSFPTRLRVAVTVCGIVTAAPASYGAATPKLERTPAPGPASVPSTIYNFHVAPTGSDTNPGNKAAPFKTIERAAKAAVPGTTVHVAPGTYPGGFKTTVSGTAKDRISFVSTVKWGAKIVPPAKSTTPTAWDNRGNYVDIVGFDVDGSAHQAGTRWTAGIYSGGSYDRIEYNHVHHIATTIPCTSAGGSGIGVDSYYHGVQSDVIGNSVHDIGPPGCRYIQGIYINTPGSVKNNIVYRIGAAGIQLWHDAHNVIISNNTVSTSNTGIIVGGGDYYYTKGPNDHTHVYNNIVYDNKIGISEQGATGKNNSYHNNLVYQNTTADWRLLNGLMHSDTVAAAPQFVKYTRTGTPDFRLSSTSPAIGKGSATHAHGTDFDGSARTAGTGYDIGAYQH
jgi:hypothetical protein